MRKLVLVCGAALLGATSTQARANEVWAGILAHEVDTPFSLRTREQGADVQIGWRGRRLAALKAIGRPAPYAFASINTDGGTHFLAAGLSWTIGKKAVYVRPAIGLALHDGRIPRACGRSRCDLGSRVLFEPELGIGVRISKKFSVEANWTHISNGSILSRQNPGLDMLGARLNFRL